MENVVDTADSFAECSIGQEIGNFHKLNTIKVGFYRLYISESLSLRELAAGDASTIAGLQSEDQGPETNVACSACDQTKGLRHIKGFEV
jgi:hypothetical protein